MKIPWILREFCTRPNKAQMICIEIYSQFRFFFLLPGIQRYFPCQISEEVDLKGLQKGDFLRKIMSSKWGKYIPTPKKVSKKNTFFNVRFWKNAIEPFVESFLLWNFPFVEPFLSSQFSPGRSLLVCFFGRPAALCSSEATDSMFIWLRG